MKRLAFTREELIDLQAALSLLDDDLTGEVDGYPRLVDKVRLARLETIRTKLMKWELANDRQSACK